MGALEKNTVSAYNQLQGAPFCYILGEEKEGPRVLFIGNSITLHGILPEIGWTRLCGMAASCAEKDYVHRCMEALLASEPQTTFAIAQLAEWEREYRQGHDTLNAYAACRDFHADLIIVRVIENCPYADFQPEVFRREYKAMIDYFNPDGKARVILTTGFWKHPGDDEVKAVAAERGYPLVQLGDLGEDDEMKAIGEYVHEGVAQHPGDKGMAAIAARIMAAIHE